MRRNKGITLITLILTVIILLILAGVTIDIVIDSDFFDTASQTVADANDKLSLENQMQEEAIREWEDTPGNPIKSESQINCNHQFGEWNVEEATCTEQGRKERTCSKCNYLQTKEKPTLGHNWENGKCIRCNTICEHTFTNGACSVCGVVPVTSSTIANATTKSDYYGKYVTGITLNNGDTETEWRIFYADTNNIYLIAADYIDAQEYVSKDLVDNKEDYTGDAPATKYKAYFSKTIELPEYDGGATEEVIFGEGTVGGTLLKTYLDYLNADSSLAKNNPNMQATAFMLDTTAWSGYTDSNQETSYIDYAIGGPTIEMLRDSYNGYQGTTSMYTSVGTYGYYVGDASTPTTNSMSIGTTNDLYVNDTTTAKASAYWLASPSARRKTAPYGVMYSGKVYGGDAYSNHNYGFRPLIRLNKNAKLTPSGTDTYTVSY